MWGAPPLCAPARVILGRTLLGVGLRRFLFPYISWPQHINQSSHKLVDIEDHEWMSHIKARSVVADYEDRGLVLLEQPPKLLHASAA